MKSRFFLFLFALGAFMSAGCNFLLPDLVELEAPYSVYAEAREGAIYLSWYGDYQSEGYYVYRSAGTDGSYSLLQTLDSWEEYYEDTEVSIGSEYHYYITAYSGGFESAASETVSASPRIPQVTGLTAEIIGSDVHLSWDSISGVSGYRVAGSSSSWTNEDNYSFIAEVTSPEYVIYGASQSTYYYAVSAFAGDQEGDASDRVDGSMSALPRPQNLVEVSASYSEVELSWDPVDGAVSYSVYRDSYSSLSESDLLMADVSGTSFTDTALPGGTRAYYAVRAYRANGDSSSMSSSIQVTFPVVPVPTDLMVNTSADGKDLMLSWTGIDEPGVSYEIYRNTSSYVSTSSSYLVATVDSPSFIDTEPAPGDRRYYKVITVLGSRESSASSTAAGRVLTAPEDVAVGESGGTAEVSWYYSSTWPSSVQARIERTLAFVTPSYSVLGTVDASTRSFTDDTAVIGGSYVYRVTFVDGVGETFTDSADTTITGKVGGVSASNETELYEIHISWDAFPGADSYTVYRSTSEGGSYTEIGTAVAESYVDSSLSSASTYYYRVSATVGTDTYPMSDPDQGRTWGIAPPAPSVVREYTSQNGYFFHITWGSKPGSDWYEVHLQVDTDFNGAPDLAGHLINDVTGNGNFTVRDVGFDPGLNEFGEYRFYIVAYRDGVASAQGLYTTWRSHFSN